MTRPGEDPWWTYPVLWLLYLVPSTLTRIERRIRRWVP